MKKMTRAFQLDPMPEPVKLYLHPKTKLWYADNGYEKGSIFIYGEGYKKITKKWKQEIVQPLSNPFTAEELKQVADKFGVNGALAMVRGWGNGCLLNDQSYGLTYAKYEVANMATFGKAYDHFTDEVQKIGDTFINGLLANGFTLQGTKEKGTLWYGYKNKKEYGHLTGFTGVYEKIKLHPLLYIDHSIGASFVTCRIPPIFNPMSFDELLITLFLSKYSEDYKKAHKMLDKIVSVKDRIEHLAGVESAKAIENIFELQKELK